MTVPTLSEEIPRKIRQIFPKSEPRQKIAFTLMYYDHWPTTSEINEIAADAGRTQRTVYQVMEKLQEAELFTKTEGSIPLYRVKVNKQARELTEHAEVSERVVTSEDKTRQIEPLKVVTAQPEVGVPAEPQKTEDASVAVGGDFEARVDRMEVQIDSLRKTVEGSMQQIEARLNALGSQNQPPTNEVTETVNLSTPTQTGEAGGAEQFQGVSREELMELLMNRQPLTREGDDGPRLQTVEAPKEMVRRMIVEVTTFTQMLYEKALNDGAFEGTFSDFLNWAPAKYFEDRGWALDWHKWEPVRRPQ